MNLCSLDFMDDFDKLAASAGIALAIAIFTLLLFVRLFLKMLGIVIETLGDYKALVSNITTVLEEYKNEPIHKD